MLAPPSCKCGGQATAKCLKIPPLCGACCTPSCGCHLKDVRKGEKREGSKRGQNSGTKRAREWQSWNAVKALEGALLEIAGMERSLKDRRLTTRQLMRKVIQHYSNSLTRCDSEDPLAEFPAGVRELCLDLAASFLGPGGIREAEEAHGHEETLPAGEAGGVDAEPSGGGEAGAGARETHLQWTDVGQEKCGPPEKAVLVEELGPEKAEVRLRVWRRLHDPGESAQLLADVQRAGLSKEAFERMQQHICPLAFGSQVQYQEFMDELCICIGSKFRALQSKTDGQALRGFWLILGGSATKLFSEGCGSFTVCCR